MNYVVEGAMIGGFALVAAPAEYGVTGLKTFIVSNDGIVYQKAFGPATLNEFIKMELFIPDQSCTPVPEEEGKDLVDNRLLLGKETTFGRRVGMFRSASSRVFHSFFIPFAHTPKAAQSRCFR